jgi:osmotically-inducible protein OsmY
MKTNEELQRDVMAEIQWDPELKEVAPEIGVSAKDGVVTLSGIVGSYSKKIATERAAQRVKGVKVVAVDIEVAVPNAPGTTDAELATAVRNALMWNSNVDEDKIEVKVDNGWVFLDGEVDWKFEKAVAETMVEGLAGIRGIANNIKIRPRELDEQDIKRRISAAFHRNATVDSRAVRVEVTGATIRLRGTVQSPLEKEEAARIAWSSPGVFEVDNQIAIDTETFD